MVPIARRLGPSIIADTLVVNQTSTGGVLTTNATAMRRRFVGFFNYRGTVRTPIVPKEAKALRLPDGGFAAKISKPRKVRGMHCPEHAVDERTPDVVRELDRELPRIMQRRLDGISL